MDKPSGWEWAIGTVAGSLVTATIVGFAVSNAVGFSFFMSFIVILLLGLFIGLGTFYLFSGRLSDRQDKREHKVR